MIHFYSLWVTHCNIAAAWRQLILFDFFYISCDSEILPLESFWHAVRFCLELLPFSSGSQDKILFLKDTFFLCFFGYSNGIMLGNFQVEVLSSTILKLFREAKVNFRDPQCNQIAHLPPTLKLISYRSHLLLAVFPFCCSHKVWTV